MGKKLIIAFLAMAMLFSLGHNTAIRASSDSTSVESEIIITPFFTYISSLGASISFEAAGKAIPSGVVFYLGNYNSTLTIELQRSNGNGWSTVKSWNKSFTGRGTHVVEEAHYVTSGYSYRTVLTVVIKNGNTVLETATATSSQVSY